MASSGGAATGRAGATDDSADEITVALVRQAEADLPGAITVTVPVKILSAGKPFSFPIPARVVEAAGGEILKVKGMDGKGLPAWLKYSPGSNTFTADNVRPGTMPIKVLVSTNSRLWTLVITERAGH